MASTDTRFVTNRHMSTVRRGTVVIKHIADAEDQPICGTRLRQTWPVSVKDYQLLLCQRCSHLVETWHAGQDLVDNRQAQPDLLAPQATIHALGLAAYNLSFARFCEILGEPEGDYSRDKYDQFKRLGRAMSAFTDRTLLQLSADYLPLAGQIVSH